MSRPGAAERPWLLAFLLPIVSRPNGNQIKIEITIDKVGHLMTAQARPNREGQKGISNAIHEANRARISVTSASLIW